jgi:hypothetical protein
MNAFTKTGSSLMPPGDVIQKQSDEGDYSTEPKTESYSLGVAKIINPWKEGCYEHVAQKMKAVEHSQSDTRRGFWPQVDNQYEHK